MNLIEKSYTDWKLYYTWFNQDFNFDLQFWNYDGATYTYYCGVNAKIAT